MAVPAQGRRAGDLRRRASARHPWSAAASEARGLQRRRRAAAVRFAAGTPLRDCPLRMQEHGDRVTPSRQSAAASAAPAGPSAVSRWAVQGPVSPPEEMRASAPTGAGPATRVRVPAGAPRVGFRPARGRSAGSPGNSGGGCCAGSESTRDRSRRRSVAECVPIMRIGTREGSARSSRRAGAGHAARNQRCRRGMRATVS